MGKHILYVDGNAIAPQKVKRIVQVIESVVQKFWLMVVVPLVFRDIQDLRINPSSRK
ncbi:hypothetical protein [uncultured Nostoc sp.]|uniref:hypothetical protein n=1 Tax=uncultured Nostoc sp. TaxID=340711 RepID=UPI0035C97FFB